MKAIAFLCGLLISVPTLATDPLHFVRSDADCEANGCGLTNGTSYANAWRMFSDMAFSAVDGTSNAFDPGDTLFICSDDFDTTDLDIVGATDIMMSFTADISGPDANNYTTIEGNCSNYGGPVMGKIDGENTTDRGISDIGAGTQYIQIRNLEVTGFNVYGIYNQSALATTADYWLIDNVYIHDNPGAASIGIFGKGGNTSITNSFVDGMGADGVYWEGNDFTFTDNRVYHVSLDSVIGDGLQYGTTESLRYYIARNVFQSDVDIKQGVLIGNLSGQSGTLEDNICLGPTSTGSDLGHSCFIISGPGLAIARRNYAQESRYLIYSGSGSELIAYGNVGHSFLHGCIQCGAGTGGSPSHDCQIFNNSCSGAQVCYSSDAGTGVNIIRNNIGVGCTDSGIDKDSDDLEDHNIIYNSTDVVRDDLVTAAPSATTTTADPRFVGGDVPSNAAGFKLRSGSPARGSGTVVGPYHDYRNCRFDPAQPSKGAYEICGGDER